MSVNKLDCDTKGKQVESTFSCFVVYLLRTWELVVKLQNNYMGT